MAKSPAKRRGIMLGNLGDNAAPPDLLSGESTFTPKSPEQLGTSAEVAGADSKDATAAMMKELAQLRQTNADLDVRWQHQADQLQQQLQQLEQQRDQLELQTRQLQALEQRRRASRRFGALMSLLVLSGAAALGYHSWPQLQSVAGDLGQLRTRLVELGPQLQAVHAEVSSLASRIGEADNTMASLREDISGARSDIGSLRNAVDTSPDHKAVILAEAGSAQPAARTVSRNATTMTSPYWAMRPRRPW